MTIVRLNKSGLIYPLTVAEGATLAASFTANALIAGGASTSAALQAWANGTLDQYMESLGSASLGQWKDQNQLGGLKLIQTQTITSSTPQLDITNLTTDYSEYILDLSSIVPVTNSDTLACYTSSNNGVSFDTGVGNYAYTWSGYPDSGTAGANAGSSSTSATAMLMAVGISNTVFANDFTFIFENPAVSLYGTGPCMFGKFKGATGPVIKNARGSGFRLTQQINNAFRIKFTSGNIAQVYAKLYGRVAP